MKRIYHRWDAWECYPAGFYDTKPRERTLTEGRCRAIYADFLRNIPAFEEALAGVLRDWPNSCEHYLSNENMNRIAWLGQASLCYATGIPARFRGGFNQLTTEEQSAANLAALRALNAWLEKRGEPTLPNLDAAASRTQMDLY